VFGYVCFFALASVLVVEFYTDNTTVLSTFEVVVVDDSGVNEAAQDKPFQSSNSTLSTAKQAALLSGVEIRLLVSGQSGVCGSANTTSWSAADVSRDSFSFSSVPSCSGAANVAQLTWTCRSCIFTATSALSIQLHWSCQALLVEAVAISSDGSTRASHDFVAADLTGLLSTVSWALQPMLVVSDDNKIGREWKYVRQDFLGYQLIPGKLLKTVVPSGVKLQPAAQAVSFVVDLSPNPLFLSVVFNDTQTVFALLSSIIGLGGIFAFFGSAFTIFEPWLKGKSKRIDALPRPVRRVLYSRHEKNVEALSVQRSGSFKQRLLQVDKNRFARAKLQAVLPHAASVPAASSFEFENPVLRHQVREHAAGVQRSPAAHPDAPELPPAHALETEPDAEAPLPPPRPPPPPPPPRSLPPPQNSKGSKSKSRSAAKSEARAAKVAAEATEAEEAAAAAAAALAAVAEEENEAAAAAAAADAAADEEAEDPIVVEAKERAQAALDEGGLPPGWEVAEAEDGEIVFVAPDGSLVGDDPRESWETWWPLFVATKEKKRKKKKSRSRSRDRGLDVE
jgi:hypothetical protein